jgi:hypothetical protein
MTIRRQDLAGLALAVAILGYSYPLDLNAQSPENRICSGTLIVSASAPDVALEIRTKEGTGSCFFVRGSPVAERILATCALNEPCKVWAVVGRSGSLFAIAEVRDVKREGATSNPAHPTSPYVVDGLALGESVHFGSAGTMPFRCSGSDRCQLDASCGGGREPQFRRQAGTQPRASEVEATPPPSICLPPVASDEAHYSPAPVSVLMM